MKLLLAALLAAGLLQACDPQNCPMYHKPGTPKRQDCPNSRPWPQGSIKLLDFWLQKP